MWDKPNEFDALLLAWQVKCQVEERKRFKLERQVCEEALERCGFKALPVHKATENRPQELAIVNANGDPLTPVERGQLERAFDEVRKEYKERLEAEKAREEAARKAAAEAEAAAEKARYDAAAAPYREARRLRMKKRFEAEQASKGRS